MSLFDRLQQLWSSASADSPPDLNLILDRPFTGDAIELLGVLRWDQQQRWKTSQPLRAEEYLEKLPDLQAGVDWMFELALGEFEARRDSRQPLSDAEISSRFPQLSGTLRDRLIPQIPTTPKPPAEAVPETEIRDASDLSVTYITGRGMAVGEKGRYRLDRVLGEGAFGRVYLGYDDQLHRQVAIKVPNPERFRQGSDAEAYLAEARTVAALEHTSIVPVHTAERTDDGSVFIVSRYLDGGTLKDQMTGEPWDPRKAAELLIPVARGLHFAHQKRLIHRDVKPANILLESGTGTPFIADFGLAIREDEYLHNAAVAGTPAYMSPEQARGEGHRLDGRSDLFSLGVILYELLTGKRPFAGNSVQDIVREVISSDPKPPRQLQESIPSELERICLKALSKRASDRYATAAAFAEDLEEWLSPKAAPATTMIAPVTVVPKGLRSFDAGDADFFLDLLPGPRNRDGLPESIAFWKQRIEETDPEKTFNVGLIYGPSGCGKSSLVKAGLLSHLSRNIIPVYLEATPEETELRILRGLRKQLPGSDESLSLVAMLTNLRRQETPADRRGKVVIIIDQFEQWLHAHPADSEAELVQAIRQCDGAHVQAIVMIRDDFAMAAARFMQALDVSILQGHNFATVDLFETDHARKVLIKFGEAFGRLPGISDQRSAKEQQFVDDAAHGLAQDGRVVSVRLALFAEMVKGKPWDPDTLQAVGGTEGIGVNFLEETFSSPQANPRHRLHANAARGVLRSLLPQLGSNIRGHMRSSDELLNASGYLGRPNEFNDLLRILDGELRLITPTDPEGDTLSGPPVSPSHSALRYYQLTHDYLVPSLREWLTRKQRETRRGRAELKLEERSAIWNARRENKQLPTVGEWFQIRTLTDSKRWTESQRAMMGKAALVHGGNWIGLLLIVTLIGIGIQQWASAYRWQNLKDQTRVAAESLQNNLGPAIAVNLKELTRLPADLVRPELEARFTSATNPRHKLALAYALASHGKLDTAYLVSMIDNISQNDTDNYMRALLTDPSAALAALKAESSGCIEPSLWRRKANLSIVAIGLGDSELAAEVCAYDGRSDQTPRTLFIDQFRRWNVNPDVVLQSVINSESSALRSAICLAIGQVSEENLSESDREAWKSLASRWFAEKADSSTHSAAGWLLRQWNLPVPEVPTQHEIHAERDWYVVKTSGATMLRIRPPVSSTSLPDPLEKYRQQLLELTAADASQQQTPEHLMQHAIACYHTGKPEQALRDLELLRSVETVPNDPAPGSYPWKIQVFAWPDAGPMQPPADWEAVVNSKPITEQILPLLNLGWRRGNVVSGIPAEHFAVVATAEPELAAGTYVLRTSYDDGVRVYVDEQLLVDHWKFNHETTDAVQFTVDKGRHRIRVEYFQITGGFALTVDLAASNSPRLQPTYAARHANMLNYRTLTLARLGRTDDAKQSLMECTQTFGDSPLLDIQVAAWLGDATEASRLLDLSGLKGTSDPVARYNLACTAALCSQALVMTNPVQSREFSDKAVSYLRQAVALGFSDEKHTVGDSDLAVLHSHSGFLATLAEMRAKATPAVSREFWCCDREVSRRQIEQFVKDPDYPSTEKPGNWKGVHLEYSPTPEHPAQQIDLATALMYCNWLSIREGLRPCYERTSSPAQGNGNRTADTVWKLLPEASGYRLPGDAEWTLACSTGTTTDFFFGNDDELLGPYAHICKKAAESCGRKLPNAWGLHDMTGNVFEWCGDVLTDDQKARPFLRGGCFFNGVWMASREYRYLTNISDRSGDIGFRIVRAVLE